MAEPFQEPEARSEVLRVRITPSELAALREAGAGYESVSSLVRRAIDAQINGWEYGRWWRVVAPDGSLWSESSDYLENLEAMRPGDTLWRSQYNNRTRWVEVPTST